MLKKKNCFNPVSISSSLWNTGRSGWFLKGSVRKPWRFMCYLLISVQATQLAGKHLYTFFSVGLRCTGASWVSGSLKLDLFNSASASQKQAKGQRYLKVFLCSTWFLLCPVVSGTGVCLGVFFPPHLLLVNILIDTANKCQKPNPYNRKSLLEIGRKPQPDRKTILLCRCACLLRARSVAHRVLKKAQQSNNNN